MCDKKSCSEKIRKIEEQIEILNNPRTLSINTNRDLNDKKHVIEQINNFSHQEILQFFSQNFISDEQKQNFKFEHLSDEKLKKQIIILTNIKKKLIKESKSCNNKNQSNTDNSGDNSDCNSDSDSNNNSDSCNTTIK